MGETDSTVARRIAHAVSAFEYQRTGHAAQSVSVVLSDDTLVITLRGALSPAEKELAGRPEAAAKLRELHRQLFADTSAPLLQAIQYITGVEVCEGSVEIEVMTGAVMQRFATGTVVQVFLLAGKVATDAWSGRVPVDVDPIVS